MADLWVPFAAAFIAAGAVLLVRQAILTWTRRPSARRPRPVASRAIIPVKNVAVEQVRIPRVEITPGRPVSQARPFAPIIIGAPATIPEPVPGRVILATVVPQAPAAAATQPAEAPVEETAAAEPLPAEAYVEEIPVADAEQEEVHAAGTPAAELEPSASATAASEPSEADTTVISTRRAPRRDTPSDIDNDQSRRLRIAVGPGRPSTTVGAEAKVWSSWTQEVRSPESTPPAIAVPVEADQKADEDCPHCASARYRGSRFCGRCGRSLGSAVTTS